MIKWIGQHIVSLIARFRDDVYLENLAETTQDHVVGIDSDGKLYKQDTPSGGMTNFTVEDGDTTDVVISDGKHWKFVEGGGIDINWTDTSDGSSSDEYDLTFTMNKSLQDLLIDASHVIRGDTGSDVTLQSAGGFKFQVDYDESTAPGTHTFAFVNGAGATVASIDESGIPTFAIGGKGSSATSVVVDGGSGDLKSRTLAEFKSDVSLNNVENKSSATIRGEIVDSDVPALNASKVNAGTFDDARIPSLGASKVTSGTFDDARIPDLGASKVTSGTFADARIPDLNVSKLTAGTLSEARGGTGVADVKTIVTRQVFTGNFLDDLGTDKHYIPLVDSPNEQTVRYRHEAAIVAPCDGRVASISVRFENLNTHSGDAVVTVGVEKIAAGVSYAGTWSVEETEPVTLPDTADHDTVHFHFNNDKHFDSAEMFAVSIQSDTDITGTNERFWITAVVEWDWSTYLGTKGTTTIYASTP